MLNVRRVALAVVMTVLASSPLVAEPNDTLAEAKTTFQRGLEAYDARDYQEALKFFERSYGLSHKPEILFDIAQTHAALGDCLSAVEKLDELARVGNEVPALADRAKALRRELLPCAPQAAQPVPPPMRGNASGDDGGSTASRMSGGLNLDAPSLPSAPAGVAASPSETAHRLGWNALSWGAAGATAACALAGVVLELDARTSQQSVESAQTWGPTQLQEDERGRTLSATGVGLLVAASVTAATAVVAYVAGRRHPR